MRKAGVNKMIGMLKKDIPEHLLSYFKPKRIYKKTDDGMIPHRVYDALMADGWYGRMDIVWTKPNPLPESVKDRPTKAHEYIFLLSKSGDSQYWTHKHWDYPGTRVQPDPDYEWTRKDDPTVKTRTEPDGDWSKDWSRNNLWERHRYYYDAEAIKEPLEPASVKRVFANDNVDDRKDGKKDVYAISGKSQSKYNQKMRNFIQDGWDVLKNKKSVWNVPVYSYRGAHFAVFPPRLIEPAILAGASPRACETCGAPWSRMVKHGSLSKPRTVRGYQIGIHPKNKKSANSKDLEAIPKVSVGWGPTCACVKNEGLSKSIVLDPFAGSGTTIFVALENSRDAIGIELNPEYVPLIHQRVSEIQPKLFS